MITTTRWTAVFSLALALGLAPSRAEAQVVARQARTATSAIRPVASIRHATDARGDQNDERWFQARPVVRIWQNYTLPAASAARDVLVISSDAAIDGEVYGDVVVLLGSARVGPAAVIHGSLVVVAGNATLDEGASIARDLRIVGGQVTTPTNFAPGGEQIVIGATWLGDRIRSVLPWVTRGLLWGRVMVPDLGWMWALAVLLFMATIAINLFLHAPIARAADVVAARPFSTLLSGLLVFLLIGPVCALLAASVVGLAVLPFLFAAIAAAWIAGQVGVLRAIGRSVLPRRDQDESARAEGAEREIEREEDRLRSLRAVSVGFAALLLVCMVPVLGLIAWALFSVFGVGAATLALVANIRRERSARRAAAAPPVAPAREPVPVAARASVSAASAVDRSDAAAYAVPFSLPTVPPPGPAFRPDETFGTRPGDAGDLLHQPHATFLDRLAAFALDIALILIINGLIVPRPDKAAVFFVLLFAYLVGAWAWKGTTVGGIVCNLRIMRTDGTPMRFVEALVRGLSGLFSLVVLGLGFLWILRDPERQAWHDKIASTFVVRVPRAWPLP